ncbi:Mannosyl-oligosaccharide 1,2-alpha-mannosidase-like protein [Hapsidospora chrysogenum ATCC 11550]|uniref:alpha-1,2-Mannosidase n=1 Tax=Hapsidospora chrysogenum (strain ATCC 11550 / CBS 779.69 / DSM 880 / IAM 14645 / JCM 23072 / IMI 49137) TaxID=857340 RepID=A0A086T3J4_HAPC1|nr:Mannosyl-oligosaccharide 1,2-alpha-mannosidase-like protein [Hapsidospora chrysogenum ATCC 11550]
MLRRRRSRLVNLTFAALVLLAVFLFLRSRSSRPRYVPSGFDWTQAPVFHPPGPIKPLPDGEPRPLPSVQAPLSAFTNPSEPDPRRDAVLQTFKRSYEAYKTYAWGHDELAPVTRQGRDPSGGYGATLMETLDTLWIMGLKSEFYEAAAFAAAVDFTKPNAGAVGLFETTVRNLAGLLSAYDLSAEEALLHKATDLGNMLYIAFDTPNRLPGFWLNWQEAWKGDQKAGTNEASSLSTSLCLEFTRLSQLTGDPKYYDATDRITRFLERMKPQSKLQGMWPTTIDYQNEYVWGDTFSLGAGADSLYEYLPKMFALLGGLDPTYETLYRGAADTASKFLLFRPMLPDGQDILFAGDARVVSDAIEVHPEFQHLTCFAGGMFGLGGKLFGISEHLDIGERLARGCAWAYTQFPTGLMPERFTLLPCGSRSGCAWDENRWLQEGNKKLNKGWGYIRDSRYNLRPEAIESVFLLYRMTGKEEYRDLAWEMWQGIMKSTRSDIAHCGIRDVTESGKPAKSDDMESFWLAATLKYFYLIFSPPDLIHLDEFVFNTRGHPFRRPV